MTRLIVAMATVAILVPSTAQVFAHDQFRVIGTVTRQRDSRFDVKTKEGKTISIALDEQTLVSRDKKKVPRAELKTGRYVVVDAYGDSEADLLALEVRIVPTPAK